MYMFTVASWLLAIRWGCHAAPAPHCRFLDAVLQCTPFLPEARAVLDLVDQCPKQAQKGKFPVVVIEGLDATGKSMLPFGHSSELTGQLGD